MMKAGEKAEITTPTDRTIRVERVFDAPRERLFEVLCDPALIPEWYGPRGGTTVVEEMNPEAGGLWRYSCEDADGNRYGFRGVYREVTPPERIVQTWEWDGMPGHVNIEEMTLEDLGGQTKIVNVSTFHQPEERDGMLQSGMEGGMNETYERLDEVLAR